MSTEQATTRERIALHMQSSTILDELTLSDGSTKRLVAHVAGPAYAILHVADGIERTVFGTQHADEAASVFEVFAGATPGWHGAYGLPGASQPGRDAVLAPVYAVGTTLLDCVSGFLARVGDTLSSEGLVPMDEEPTAEFQWSVRFASARSGTGFKAAGRKVPGGYVITWWK